VPWFFSFQVLGLGLRSWRLEGRFFFSSCILVWTVDSGHWTFHASFIGGQDLFSFQPMGGPKVPCFYSF
jgi:hypothetical protein